MEVSFTSSRIIQRVSKPTLLLAFRRGTILQYARSGLLKLFIITLSVTLSSTSFAGKKEKTGKKKKALDISAFIMLDANRYDAYFDDNAESSTLDTQIRRARVELKHRAKDNWAAKLQIDYDNNDDEFKIGTAYLKYKEFSWAHITVGKLKEPIGLDRLTSSSDTSLIERSMVTSAFTPGKSHGVLLSKGKKNYSWAIGFFQDPDDDDYDFEKPTAITGRVTYSPVNNEKQTVHMGVAFSSRDWNKNEFQIKESGEVNPADNIILSAEFNADQQETIGAEFAYRYRSLHLQSEYFQSDIDDSTSDTTWDYAGYYLQASFFPHHEYRHYKKGKFKRIKAGKKRRSIELVTRYSKVELRDTGLGNSAVGANASATSLGVNYYFSKRTKLMFNLIKTDIEGNTLHAEDDGDAISLRLQHRF